MIQYVVETLKISVGYSSIHAWKNKELYLLTQLQTNITKMNTYNKETKKGN